MLRKNHITLERVLHMQISYDGYDQKALLNVKANMDLIYLVTRHTCSG